MCPAKLETSSVSHRSINKQRTSETSREHRRPSTFWFRTLLLGLSLVQAMAQAAASTTDAPELPPTVARVKAKLEESTGKKYKYRPKESMPSIQELLAQGSPEEEEQPKTFLYRARYPILMALLFCATFFIFIRLAPKAKAPIVLPTAGNVEAMKERIRIVQQKREEAARLKRAKLAESQSAGSEL